jgi:hypothetical protein
MSDDQFVKFMYPISADTICRQTSNEFSFGADLEQFSADPQSSPRFGSFALIPEHFRTAIDGICGIGDQR